LTIVVPTAALIVFVVQYCPSLMLVDAIEAEQIAVKVCDALCVHELRSTLNLRLFWCLNMVIFASRHGKKDARKKKRVPSGGG
jgi:hypothetical protein